MRFAGLGVELAASVVLFLYAGYRLDLWLGNEKPAFLAAGGIVGVAVGLYGVMRKLLPERNGGNQKDGKG